MTGRYEALKGALVAPLTTLLGGREEGGGRGRSQLLEASCGGPRGLTPPRSIRLADKSPTAEVRLRPADQGPRPCSGLPLSL